LEFISKIKVLPELEYLLDTGLGAAVVRDVVLGVVVVVVVVVLVVVVVVGRNLVTLIVGRGVVTVVVAGIVDGASESDDAAGWVLDTSGSTDDGVDRLVQLFHHLNQTAKKKIIIMTRQLSL
jgi:hypothetical protein